MITAKYNFEKHLLKINGHAGAAEIGKDIYCAGVSTLVYTMVKTLLDAQEDGILEDLDIQNKNGRISIKCTPKEEYTPNIDTIYMVIFNGMEALADSYPEYIRFIPTTGGEKSSSASE